MHSANSISELFPSPTWSHQPARPCLTCLYLWRVFFLPFNPLWRSGSISKPSVFLGFLSCPAVQIHLDYLSCDLQNGSGSLFCGWRPNLGFWQRPWSPRAKHLSSDGGSYFPHNPAGKAPTPNTLLSLLVQTCICKSWIGEISCGAVQKRNGLGSKGKPHLLPATFFNVQERETKVPRHWTAPKHLLWPSLLPACP